MRSNMLKYISNDMPKDTQTDVGRNNFVPAYLFAKTKNVQPQTVYGWIRSGRIKKGQYRIVERSVKRIEIDASINIEKRSNGRS